MKQQGKREGVMNEKQLKQVVGSALAPLLIANSIWLASASYGWARLGLILPFCLGCFMLMRCWGTLSHVIHAMSYLIKAYIVSLSFVILIAICWLSKSGNYTALYLLCFFLTFPLILAGKSFRTLNVLGVGMAYLLFLMWLDDFDNGIESWCGWRLIIRLAALAIPLSAIMLGNQTCRSGRELLISFRARAPHDESSMSQLAIAIQAGVLMGLNLGAIVTGIYASSWLKTMEYGPFCQGFWHVFGCVPPAPSTVHLALAHPVGKWLCVIWGVILSLAAIALARRTGRIRDIIHGCWIAFSLSGALALWAFWDVFCNGSALLFMWRWKYSLW